MLNIVAMLDRANHAAKHLVYDRLLRTGRVYPMSLLQSPLPCASWSRISELVAQRRLGQPDPTPPHVRVLDARGDYPPGSRLAGVQATARHANGSVISEWSRH